MQIALEASISLLPQMQAASVGEQVEFNTAVVRHFAFKSLLATQVNNNQQPDRGQKQKKKKKTHRTWRKPL